MARETLKEKVYQEIYRKVANGIYEPNDILTESQLVDEYGVSKSPVREALIELCKDGILKNLPRMGYQVIPVTLKEVIDSLELRVDIEITGLRRAFPLITDQNLILLYQTAQKHQTLKDRVISENWSRNYEFHTCLYSINGNAYAYKMLTQLIRQSSRYVSQYFQSAWQRESESNGKYHLAIVEALKVRDIDEACRMLEKDIMAVKEEILTLHSVI